MLGASYRPAFGLFLTQGIDKQRKHHSDDERAATAFYCFLWSVAWVESG